MAPRRNIRKREAQLAFEAITIEGGLLSPEWLAKIAQLQAEHQTDADYRILKGLALRDEIGRFWRVAQAHWAEFKAGLEGKADPQALAERLVVGLLRESFGFSSLEDGDPVVLGGRTYPVGHRAMEGRVPVVVAPAGSGLDALSPAFGEDGRRRSAFGLAQEYLNADENALWGIASDGLTLRLCRDNASLTRPSWLEADLGRIFTEERFADFAALWLVLHETRFGAPGQPVTDCALEVWRTAGREEGTRARDHLRQGVEEALVALGRGFLTHPDNQALRSALHGGQLTRDAYFQELLRLVYRLIFLLTAEERNVLHPAGAPEGPKSLYEKGYGLRRLRDRAARRSAHDRFSDLWEGIKVVFRGVATGEPRLALPALGGLFGKDQCPDLDAGRIENRWLLTAVFKLSWLREEASLSRVNWRDMGPEELGSVYESLLELVPQIPEDGRGFSFATGDETKGNARKTTGSYYTPDSLVQVLLDSALEPVVQQTVVAHPENSAEALLRLSVVDPACGSGHFLLAAARRLATHVARLQANGTPSAEQYRQAVRQVVSRCVYGVDLNPMAVELCRVSLWMEALEPGKPLNFLDSHIQRGNALLGTTRELMAMGIPDVAFDPIEGDDKKTASLLKKRNKAAAEGQRGLDALWTKSGEKESAEVAQAAAEVDAASDADLAAVAGKEALWDELQVSDAYLHQKFVADAWCAAFVWPKPPTEAKKVAPLVESAPTNELWRQIRDRQGKALALTVKTVEDLANQYHFFHWQLAFPQVFARGGFDVVLGNPPWEKVKLKEQEFFAERNDAVANAPTAAQRKRLIEGLKTSDAVLWASWIEAKRSADGQASFARRSGYYPRCGVGDVNTYALFAELFLAITGAQGRAGIVIPFGIATQENTSEYFNHLAATSRLVSLYQLENLKRIFPAVHPDTPFVLLTLSKLGDPRIPIDFVFCAETVEELRDTARHIRLSAEDIALLNPNTKTCPVFKTRREADVTKAIYRRVPVLVRTRETNGNPWSVEVGRMFHSSEDSSVFAELAKVSPDALKLYESKCFFQYDHRYQSFSDDYSETTLDQKRDATFSAGTRFYVERADAPEKYRAKIGRWMLAYRRITNATNERTLIASILPEAGLLDSANMFSVGSAEAAVDLLAALNSLPADFCSRQSIGGTNLHVYVLQQVAVPPPATFDQECAWRLGGRVHSWLLPRVLELTFTAWDLEHFARDVGYDGPPFRWDPDRRFLLRAELDAAFFHLYGITRDDVDYIMETFPIVRKNDEKAHGEYRTKRVVLEIYDEMTEAIRTGKPYQTRLDPPPADPSVAHPPRKEVVS